MAGLLAWSRAAGAAAGTRPATTAVAVSRTAGRRTNAPYWARSQTASPLITPVPAVQRRESAPGSGDASLITWLLVERLGGRSHGPARRSLPCPIRRPVSARSVLDEPCPRGLRRSGLAGRRRA